MQFHWKSFKKINWKTQLTSFEAAQSHFRRVPDVIGPQGPTSLGPLLAHLSHVKLLLVLRYSTSCLPKSKRLLNYDMFTWQRSLIYSLASCPVQRSTTSLADALLPPYLIPTTQPLLYVLLYLFLGLVHSARLIIIPQGNSPTKPRTADFVNFLVVYDLQGKHWQFTM